MPAYVIEFLSGRGPQSRRFTLDDDRALRPQIEQVLAELERVGIVLQGAASDELAVYAVGREVDVALSPATLGLTPDRPLELRMQRRRPSVAVPPPPPEEPAARFTPKGVYAGTAWGMIAGVAAWLPSTLIEDRTALLSSDPRLDGVTAAIWGGVVALALAWSGARRLDRPAVGQAAIAAVAGAALGAGWIALVATLTETLAAAPTPGQARALRIGAWAGLAVTTALAARLAGRLTTRDALGSAGSLVHALGGALAGGVVTGAIGGLPGAAALWMGLASAVAGAGVGVALAGAAARDATAVLELESHGDRAVGIVSLREWAMRDGASASVRDVTGSGEDAVLRLSYVGGRCQVRGPNDATAPRELRNEERLTVGQSRYRFRRRGVA